MRFFGFVLLLILLDGCSCNKDVCYPRFGQENLTELGVTQPTAMPRRLAATQEHNAWRFRKRVVADYVPECMHHHVNDKAAVRPLASGLGLLGCRRNPSCPMVSPCKRMTVRYETLASAAQ